MIAKKQSFESRGPYVGAVVVLGTAVSVVVLACVGLVVLGVSVATVLAAVFAILLALLIPSALYSVAGRLVVERGDSGWSVTRGLWGWKRTRAVPPRLIRHIEKFTHPVTRGGPNRGVLVYLVRQDKPIEVGVGLELTDAELAEIEEMLAPEIEGPAREDAARV